MDDATGNAILADVADGIPQATACKNRDVPHIEFWRWCKMCAEHQGLLDEAREVGAHALVGQVMELADTIPDPARARVKADNLKWLARVQAPQTFGDKVNLDVTGSIDLTAAMSAGLQRLRPISDLAEDADTQVIDGQAETLPRTTDNKSLAAPVTLPPRSVRAAQHVDDDDPLG